MIIFEIFTDIGNYSTYEQHKCHALQSQARQKSCYLAKRPLSVISVLVALVTYRDRRQTKQFLLLRRRLSSGGRKPGQLSAFGREIPCVTTSPEGDSQTIITKTRPCNIQRFFAPVKMTIFI